MEIVSSLTQSHLFMLVNQSYDKKIRTMKMIWFLFLISPQWPETASGLLGPSPEYQAGVGRCLCGSQWTGECLVPRRWRGRSSILTSGFIKSIPINDPLLVIYEPSWNIKKADLHQLIEALSSVQKLTSPGKWLKCLLGNLSKAEKLTLSLFWL